MSVCAPAMAKALLPMRGSIFAIAFLYELRDGTNPVGPVAGDAVFGTGGVLGEDGAALGDGLGVTLGAWFDLSAGCNLRTGFRKAGIVVFELDGTIAEPLALDVPSPASREPVVVAFVAPCASGNDAGVAAGGGAAVG